MRTQLYLILLHFEEAIFQNHWMAVAIKCRLYIGQGGLGGIPMVVCHFSFRNVFLSHFNDVFFK